MNYPAEVLNKDGLIYLWTVMKNKFGTVKSITVNGVVMTIDENGCVNVAVPTDNKDLTNGAGYQTAEEVQTAINNAIGTMTGVSFELVDSLPDTGTSGIIYLVASSEGAEQNGYDEYLYINSAWEKIGTTDADLTGYVKSSDLSAITNAEIDTICV